MQREREREREKERQRERERERERNLESGEVRGGNAGGYWREPGHSVDKKLVRVNKKCFTCE